MCSLRFESIYDEHDNLARCSLNSLDILTVLFFISLSSHQNV
jgi:hypothetical protein